ncbi:hypothetical protein Hanom_Chr03g00234511 [Helianthus anomalus]
MLSCFLHGRKQLGVIPTSIYQYSSTNDFKIIPHFVYKANRQIGDSVHFSLKQAKKNRAGKKIRQSNSISFLQNLHFLNWKFSEKLTLDWRSFDNLSTISANRASQCISLSFSYSSNSPWIKIFLRVSFKDPTI